MIVEIKDKLLDSVLETHECNTDLLTFLQSNVTDFVETNTPPISCFVDGLKIEPENWNTINSDVVIFPEAKDPSSILSLVIEAVVSYAVSYAISSVFGTKDNYNQTTPEGSSIYSVNAQSNSARLNGIIPQLFGTHKYYPDLLAQPFKAYEADVEYLHMLFSCGVGQYEFDEINIGNTPISRYLGDIDAEVFIPSADVTGHEAHRNIYTSREVSSFDIESNGYNDGLVAMPDGIEYDFLNNTITAIEQVDDGSGGFTPTPYNWPYVADEFIRIYTAYNSGIYKVVSVSTNVITLTDEAEDTVYFTTTNAIEADILDLNASIVGDWLGPFLACPNSAETDTVFVDLFYSGLGKVTPDGTIENVTIDLNIQYREYDSAAGGEDNWVNIDHSRTARTLDDLGESFQIDLPFSGVPEIRVRRANEESESTKIRDSVKWVGLRSELEANTSYDNITTLAVRIRGTNALSSNAENQFNVVMTRKLPIYEPLTETWSALTATNDIAPVFAYIIDDSGLGRDKIQLDDLDDLNTVWSGRADEFNAVFDSDFTLFDSLKKVLAVGFSEPIIDNGKIKAIREGITESYGQFFSYDNTTKITESGTLFNPDEPDGVSVEYFSHDTWKTESINCLLAGDLGERPEEVRAFGITDETKAWQYGMRLRRAKRYIRKTWSIVTELEALNANIGDLVTLPNRQTQTGWTEAYSGTVLTLGTDVEFTDGVDNLIGLRKQDGTLSGPYVCTYVSSNQINIADALDFVPEFDTAKDPPLFKFGTAEQWRTPAIVRSIEPQVDESATIEATAYDERVYADDDNTPP